VTKVRQLVQLWSDGKPVNTDDPDIKAGLELGQELEAGVTYRADEVAARDMQFLLMIQGAANQQQMKEKRRIEQQIETR